MTEFDSYSRGLGGTNPLPDNRTDYLLTYLDPSGANSLLCERSVKECGSESS